VVVNIHDAKTHFSRLVERAEAGEEIIIGRAGRPVARIVPFRPAERPRAPGGWEGRVHIAPDFDDLPPHITEAFQGEPT